MNCHACGVVHCNLAASLSQHVQLSTISAQVQTLKTKSEEMQSDMVGAAFPLTLRCRFSPSTVQRLLTIETNDRLGELLTLAVLLVLHQLKLEMLVEKQKQTYEALRSRLDTFQSKV